MKPCKCEECGKKTKDLFPVVDDIIIDGTVWVCRDCF